VGKGDEVGALGGAVTDPRLLKKNSGSLSRGFLRIGRDDRDSGAMERGLQYPTCIPTLGEATCWLLKSRKCGAGGNKRRVGFSSLGTVGFGSWGGGGGGGVCRKVAPCGRCRVTGLRRREYMTAQRARGTKKEK